MPLIDDDPPSTFPRGVASTRPPRCGSGSLAKPQSYRLMLSGIDSADGIWISGPKSLPPYSMTITECLPSSDRR